MRFLKNIILTAILLYNGYFAGGQDLRVEYVATEEGGFKFYCQNNTYSNYVITVDFTTLINFRASMQIPFRDTVRPGKNYLFELTRARNALDPSFKYTYSYYEGCIDPQIKDVIYLIPLSPGKSTEFLTFDYLGESFGITNPKDWYAMGFTLDAEDTVFAARKGRIVDIKESFEAKYEDIGFSSEENFVKIIHDDCSFSLYQIFKKDGILVKEGDIVIPGEPIGIAAGSNYTLGAHVRLLVYYPIEESVIRNGEITDKINYSAFITPKFRTSGKDTQLQNHSVYSSEHPNEVIFQEMNKSQIKKWLKAIKD